ncbi:hypothetical protein QP185_20200 [Sphingomonas aerolata]|uniref:hypothetical protein n=1 Tax=Sphingomonas aerolata TaxID=185951 RepID=UPI002FE2E096
MQEQPIQEFWAYDIGAGAEPAGSFKLSYTVDATASPNLAALAPLNAYIAGRFASDERSTVVAMPSVGLKAAVGAGTGGASGAPVRRKDAAPIVHILIPASFGDALPDRPLARAFDYGWQNLNDGLDGLAIDIPALKAEPNAAGLIALNVRVKDPIWPGRDVIDLSVSVRPNEARTLWLDLRDRILPNDSMYLTIASAEPGSRCRRAERREDPPRLQTSRRRPYRTRCRPDDASEGQLGFSRRGTHRVEARRPLPAPLRRHLRPASRRP